MLAVVIIGGGFSGTIAVVMLARAGYRIALVDQHPRYPEDFRAEHLDQARVEALSRMQLLDGSFLTHHASDISQHPAAGCPGHRGHVSECPEEAACSRR
jgi:2-polyprenyl-6-methoxyphenol hydroxylase-like FAD-dependent oxidoreductase